MRKIALYDEKELIGSKERCRETDLEGLALRAATHVDAVANLLEFLTLNEMEFSAATFCVSFNQRYAGGKKSLYFFRLLAHTKTTRFHITVQTHLDYTSSYPVMCGRCATRNDKPEPPTEIGQAYTFLLTHKCAPW